MKAKTYRSTRHQDLDELIRSLNRSLAGWANYFRHGVSKAVFSAIDSFTWLRLMRWIRRKYEGKHRLGMKELRRRFCDKGWQFACNGVVFTGASSRQGDPLPLPRQQHTDPVDPGPAPATADPAGKTRGAPGAARVARRVRRAGRGNPPGAILAGRPGPTQLGPQTSTTRAYATRTWVSSQPSERLGEVRRQRHAWAPSGPPLAGSAALIRTVHVESLVSSAGVSRWGR